MQPKDAVAFFRSKGYRITDEWHDMLTHAHAKAFTVARAQNIDVLAAIRGELDNALANGVTRQQFQKNLTPHLQKLGWWGKTVNAAGDEIQLGSPHRLNTIYRANMQSAYNAGRYRRHLERADIAPYWQYTAIQDSHTRPAHQALHGKVFRYDDPIWQTIYPPNGWGCRCSVRALTAKQLEREGLKAQNGAPYIKDVTAEVVSKKTGEIKPVAHTVIKLPDGSSMSPDVGWAYSAGESLFSTDIAVAQKLGQVTDVNLRAQAIQALNNSPLREQYFKAWIDHTMKRVTNYHAAVDAKDKAMLAQLGARRYKLTTLGFLNGNIHSKLLAKGVKSTGMLALSEYYLAHSHSQKHIRLDMAAEVSFYRELMQHVNAPSTQILWEDGRKELLYVVYSEEEAIKVIVKFTKNSHGFDVVKNIIKVSKDAVLGKIKGGVYEVWQ